MAVHRPSPGEAVSHKVVEAVAAAKGLDIVELGRLSEPVHPDALGALVRSEFTSRVAYRFANCMVLVDRTTPGRPVITVGERIFADDAGNHTSATPQVRPDSYHSSCPTT